MQLISQNKRCGKADIRGVIDADLVIAVMTKDDYAYSGTKHELGAAFALRDLKEQGLINKCPLVWIISNCDPIHDDIKDIPDCMTSCFENMADSYYTSVNDVLKVLDLNKKEDAPITSTSDTAIDSDIDSDSDSDSDSTAH